MEQRIRVPAANVRSEPRNTSTVVTTLLFGEPVETTGPADGNNWSPVTFTRNGSRGEGFIKATLLRDAISLPKEDLLKAARAEYERFDFGNGKENREPFFRFVGEMWAARGEAFDGTDVDQPWSACFISWCVVEKAGYRGFAASTGHWAYIKDSIAKCEAERDSPFWGFRLQAHKPAIGDLLCQWRGVRTNYDSAKVKPSFKSHCDIVIEVQPNKVIAIGGNVATNDGDDETVNIKEYPLEPTGFLKPERRLFAILRNNL